nr:hypothetical protein [Tanacetum cinerariifolium]
MAFISSTKNNSRKEDVNTTSIPTARTNVSPASVNIGAVSISQDTACAYIASQSSGSQIKFEDITQIDKDDMKEIDIKWNMALLSMRADRFWKKTGKKISIQGTDVAGFVKSKVECFNCHKMVHFARECRAPRSQDRGRRDNYKQGSKVEEQAPKALMAIDGPFRESKIRQEQGGVKIQCCSPSPTQVYSPPKKDLSWTGLPEFADDTMTDYSRPSPAIETDRPTEDNTYKVETAKKPAVKYTEQYRKPSKKSNVDHGSSWANNNNTYKSRTPRTVFHKTGRPPMRTNKPYM